ncbi:MAG TPA: FmdB family zinc ribbon protein [Vicinamibacteria bacterium]|nr:FmdB family zinc ribbon protein [Vicinamibacteria bacterium]
MPVYEFTCLSCGKEFYLVLSLRSYERKEYACPDCGSRQLERNTSSCEVVTSRKS